MTEQEQSSNRLFGPLSSVVTPIRFDDPAEVLKKPCDIPTTIRACTIGYFANSLIRCSASRIYIVCISPHLTDEILNALPPLLKPRIRWVDRKKKVQRTVMLALHPIIDELNWLSERKGQAEEHAEGSSSQEHEHGICLLMEFLHVLALAVKHKAEADVDFPLVSRAVQRIRTKISSSDARASLARVEGIVAAYARTMEIDAIGMKAVHQSPSADDLLTELLEDAEFAALSRARHMLGISSAINEAVLHIRRSVRRLLADKRKQQTLSLASQIANVAAKASGIPFQLPDLKLVQQSQYAPALVPLDSIKPNCLKTGRWLPDLAEH